MHRGYEVSTDCKVVYVREDSGFTLEVMEQFFEIVEMNEHVPFYVLQVLLGHSELLRFKVPVFTVIADTFLHCLMGICTPIFEHWLSLVDFLLDFFHMSLFID